MAISFPLNPSIGDEYSAAGKTWTWNGSQWEGVPQEAGTPSGATEDRPLDPSIGDTFYNGTLGFLEIYTSSGWLPATGANDFSVALGGPETKANLDKEYIAGNYTVSSALSDSSISIYLYDSTGEPAGYTNSPSISVSQPFNKMVVIGGTQGDLISFSYKSTFTSSDIGTETFANIGPIAKDVSPTSLPSLDDTTVVTGRNFNSDIRAFFIDSNGFEQEAKSLVYNSVNEIIVTRPDDFAVENDPFSIRLENPGTAPADGSVEHILSNSVSAGTSPVWTTLNSVYYNLGASTSLTLLATDVEDSDIDYSIVSGSLPVGLSLNGETGEVSGTFSGTANEGDVTEVTVRATDAGGNFLDKLISFTVNSSPTWETETSLAFTTSENIQVIANPGPGSSTLTYSLQSGALPSGSTLNANGVISSPGVSAIGNTGSFVVRATDEFGLFTDRGFTYSVSSVVVEEVIEAALGATTANISGETVVVDLRNATSSSGDGVQVSANGGKGGDSANNSGANGWSLNGIVPYDALSGKVIGFVGATNGTSTTNNRGAGGGGGFSGIVELDPLNFENLNTVQHIFTAGGGGGAGTTQNGRINGTIDYSGSPSGGSAVEHKSESGTTGLYPGFIWAQRPGNSYGGGDGPSNQGGSDVFLGGGGGGFGPLPGGSPDNLTGPGVLSGIQSAVPSGQFQNMFGGYGGGGTGSIGGSGSLPWRVTSSGGGGGGHQGGAGGGYVGDASSQGGLGGSAFSGSVSWVSNSNNSGSTSGLLTVVIT